MNVETNLNAVIMAFGLQRPDILDTEGVYGPLIDAVADATKRTEISDGSSNGMWAASFIARNGHALDKFAEAFTRGDYTSYSRIAEYLALDPLPADVAVAESRRYVYDRSVIRGLEELGLLLTQLDPYPDKLLFCSTWVGHDGGRLEVHEYDGLPIHVVTIDIDRRNGKEVMTRHVIHIAATDDPSLDAAQVVNAAAQLWS